MAKKELKLYVHKLYEYDYNTGTIRRKNKKCPRCGCFMAFHKYPVARWHCGRCGHTEFVEAKESVSRS